MSGVDSEPTSQEDRVSRESLESHDARELARWFLLSILRHARSEQWASPDASGLSESQQYLLADLFLKNRSAKQSLKLVLRSPDNQCCLVNFGSSRDVDSQQLVNTTKAFRHGLAVLHQSGHLSLTSQSDSDSEIDYSSPRSDAISTVSQRRAARRLMVSEPGSAGPVHDTGSRRATSEHSPAMSDEEYSALRKAIAEKDSSTSKPAHRPRIGSDQLSLIWGVLAGVVFFLVVNSLFP